MEDVDEPVRRVSFGDARELIQPPASPEFVPVDPKGFPELNDYWPVRPADHAAYLCELQAKGQRVSYAFGVMLRLWATFVRLLRSKNSSQAVRAVAQALRTTYHITESRWADDALLYERLCVCVAEARSAVAMMNEKYMPDWLMANCTSEGLLETKRDPLEMLFEIYDRPLTRPPPPRLADDAERLERILLFRMRRDLVLADRLFAIWAYMQSLTGGRDFSALMTKALEEHFFEPRMLMPCDVRLVVDVATGVPLRVLQAGDPYPLNPNEEILPSNMMVRYFRAPHTIQGKPVLYPVFYNPDGQKRAHDVLFKMLARGVGHPKGFNDLLRLELVFFDERQMEIGIQLLIERLFNTPGTILGIEDTRKHRPARLLHNPYSSAEYRVVRFDLMWNGFPIELQVHAFDNFAKGRTAKGEVGHRSYKRRQALNALRVVHPTSIFQIDWDDPGIARQVLRGW